jgi:hypothetical protein
MSKTKAHTRYRLKPTDYFPKGEIVPGVTTVIDSQLGWNKRILIAWARREALAGRDPDKILERAGDIGSIVHLLIEAHIKGKIQNEKIEPELKDYSKADIDKAENSFIAYLDWEKRNNLVYVASELRVVSEQYRAGGTIDILARNNNDLWLIDPKSSKGIYPEFIVQVAAYRVFYEYQEDEAISEVHLLHLDKKDGSFADHKLSSSQLQAAFRVFDHCRQLYNLKKEF